MLSPLTLKVLAGIRFIWSRSLRHPRISAENILISPKGSVKIGKTPGATANLINICLDNTLFPDNEKHTSADLNALSTITLLMMDETRETRKSPVVS